MQKSHLGDYLIELYIFASVYFNYNTYFKGCFL